MNSVSVTNLYKSYGNNNVIKGISFDVRQGEIFALLGINGAGKTTTLECMEGVRKYEGGTIGINGKTGVQLQTSSLMPECRVKEAIELFRRWAGCRNTPDFSSLGIDKMEGKMYRSLSIGQKKRLHLALALIGNPDILFLDEPTAGLDVEGRLQLHDEVRKLKRAGKTVILASHDMAEVEALCDRIAILRDGRIAFLGTPAELKAHREENPDDALTPAASVKIKASEDLSGCVFSTCRFEGTEQEYTVFTAANTADALFEILSYTKEKGIAVSDVQTRHTSLEQQFMDLSKEVC